MKTNGQSKIESGDSAVAIYHVVYAHEGFEESAQILFKLIQEAQQKYYREEERYSDGSKSGDGADCFNDDVGFSGT